MPTLTACTTQCSIRKGLIWIVKCVLILCHLVILLLSESREISISLHPSFYSQSRWIVWHLNLLVSAQCSYDQYGGRQYCSQWVDREAVTCQLRRWPSWCLLPESSAYYHPWKSIQTSHLREFFQTSSPKVVHLPSVFATLPSTLPVALLVEGYNDLFASLLVILTTPYISIRRAWAKTQRNTHNNNNIPATQELEFSKCPFNKQMNKSKFDLMPEAQW